VFCVKDFITVLEAKTGEIITIIFFSALGFCIYVLSQKGTLRQRLQGAALGFLISLAFSYPIYQTIGSDRWWALAMLSSILTISGQFLPELITLAFQRYAKKLIKDKLGVDSDDHN